MQRIGTRLRWSSRALCAGLAGLALAACTVGPDYAKPDMPLPKDWVERSNTAPASGEPVDVAHWWRSFGDETLNSLIERALAANLDVRSAEATVRAARAERAVVAGGEWPALDASASGSRSELSQSIGGRAVTTKQNLYRAGFDATWELDLFGGVRRGVEAADQDVLASAYDLRAVQVSLAAEVAATYFDLRTAQRELAIARENLESQRNTISLTQQRFDAGLVSALDVRNAEAQAASTSARIPAFDAIARAAIYALGSLLGQEPAALLGELSSDAPLPEVAPNVPLGLPSELLRRRPDIHRAEAALHGATARIGVATAQLYPNFSLNGTLGLAGAHVDALTNIDDRFWSLGGAVTMPLFNAGRLRANVKAQEALRDESLIAYQKTILTALQDVETALYALDRERERSIALADALRANEQAVELATELYGAGRTDFLAVLSAQNERLAAQDALAQSSHATALDLAALYKALGGGWDDSTSEPASSGAASSSSASR